MQIKTENNRKTTVDLIRGITVILMIVFHIVNSISYIKDYEIYHNTAFAEALNMLGWIVRLTFIGLAGMCVHLSSHRLNNGIKVFACGCLITLGTLIIVPQYRIIYGVLMFLGFAIITSNLCYKYLVKIPAIPGMIVCVMLFITMYFVPDGYFLTLKIPAFLYTDILTPLGFRSPEFWSYDYFSIIPWIFWFLVGFYLGKKIDIKNSNSAILFLSLKPINWIGRHALLIYMIHVPLIYGLCAIVSQF